MSEMVVKKIIERCEEASDEEAFTVDKTLQ